MGFIRTLLPSHGKKETQIKLPNAALPIKRSALGDRRQAVHVSLWQETAPNESLDMKIANSALDVLVGCESPEYSSEKVNHQVVDTA